MQKILKKCLKFSKKRLKILKKNLKSLKKSKNPKKIPNKPDSIGAGAARLGSGSWTKTTNKTSRVKTEENIIAFAGTIFSPSSSCVNRWERLKN
jgi:hypothetical protein